MTTKKQRVWVVIVIQILVLLVLAHINNYRLAPHIYMVFIVLPGMLYFTYMPYINNETMTKIGGDLEVDNDLDNFLRIAYLFSAAIIVAATIFDLTAQIKGLSIT